MSAAVTSTERQAGADPLGSLAGRLTAADRILQKERGACLFLRSWPWVTGFIAVALVLDVVLHLSGGVRLGIDLTFALLVVCGAVWGVWFGWKKRNSFEHVARILEARHPRLGSRLINILQLRAQTQDSALAPLTRELAGMAIAGYAADLRDEPIEQLARTDRMRVEAKQTALGLLGFAVLLAALFDITRTEVPRFLDPFGDHPPYSFTRLEITSPAADGVKVIYNDNLLITAESSGHRPGELYLSWFPVGHPEQTATLPMFDRGENGFTQQIENIESDIVVFAHTKNQHALSRQRRVSVILTPRLDKAWVKISPPAYTQLAPVERPFDFKNLKALEGSKIEFRLASNRPLGSGHLTVATDDAAEEINLAPTGDKQVSGGLVAKKPAQLKFSLVDIDGNPSQETWQAALTVTHDLPPDVQVTNPSADSFASMDYKAQPVIEASDDYGLTTLRIHTARNGVYDEPRTIKYDRITLHAREEVVLDFKTMDLKSGDKISLFAEAIDNAPEPHIARSKTVTFTVITAEEYNDFLRERADVGDMEAKYSKLVNELQDLIQQQKKLGDEIAALKDQLNNAKSDAEKTAARQKLDDLLAQQSALDAKLNQLAKTMENFVRDQPVYDIEAELKNTLAQKAEEIRDSVRQNEEDLKQVAPAPQPGATPPVSQNQQSPTAAQNSSPSQNASSNQSATSGKSSPGGQQPPSQKMLADFKKASDDQLSRLGATEQETEQQVAGPLQDLSLMHRIIEDINRYKDLYAAQQELAKQARAYDRSSPLNREDQLALKDLAAQQKGIGEALDELEQKFWEDGATAKEKFPKAAESAQDIAQRMGDLKFQTLANLTTREMLSGNGSNGAHLSENLRGEMEKLFSECKSKSPDMESELDQYLKIQRGLNPGNTFRQMMQSHKFGSGYKPGVGEQGNGGRDGFAVTADQNPNVLGNEALPSNSDKADRGGNGKNKAPSDATKPDVALDKNDVVQGVNPVNRESEAVQSETVIQQYHDLVDQYFKAITKEPKKETKP
ncbi:MAG TPA: hypothetical protein VGM54_24505 [Chthoniobacter sp.]